MRNSSGIWESSGGSSSRRSAAPARRQDRRDLEGDRAGGGAVHRDDRILVQELLRDRAPGGAVGPRSSQATRHSFLPPTPPAALASRTARRAAFSSARPTAPSAPESGLMVATTTQFASGPGGGGAAGSSSGPGTGSHLHRWAGDRGLGARNGERGGRGGSETRAPRHLLVAATSGNANFRVPKRTPHAVGGRMAASLISVSLAAPDPEAQTIARAIIDALGPFGGPGRSTPTTSIKRSCPSKSGPHQLRSPGRAGDRALDPAPAPAPPKAPRSKPIYDYAQHVRAKETTRIEPVPVVVVEGILTLAIPALRDIGWI